MSQTSGIATTRATVNLTRANDPQPAAQSKTWFAVYTSSRHEKRVHEYLNSRQLESFLPVYRATHRWKNGCLARIDLPLFPNYLFVQIRSQERVRVLEVPGVISLVGQGREPTPLPELEIECLRSNLPLRKFEPHPYLTIGEKVRVKGGPLAGLEGILSRRTNGCRLVITLDLIKQSVAVEVDANDLEPVMRPLGRPGRLERGLTVNFAPRADYLRKPWPTTTTPSR